MDKLTIGGKKFNNDEEIRQFLKDKFYFPDYYGMNADALNRPEHWRE
ncbi:barstar family protein [Methanococcoides sp. LMO-2]|uniref:Barstar family protein n=1 Tax=Methanococcoides cohabitans TaxID=3136559 RepID=A0ABU9KQI2_9EURY